MVGCSRPRFRVRSGKSPAELSAFRLKGSCAYRAEQVRSSQINIFRREPCTGALRTYSHRHDQFLVLEATAESQNC